MRNLKQKHILNTIKSFKITCAIIIFGGFFLVFGSVCACEYGTLSEGHCIQYAVIGLVMAAAGAIGVRWFSQFEEDDEEEKK